MKTSSWWCYKEVGLCLGLGFGFCALQLSFSVIMAPHDQGLRGAYFRLNAWDSAHYLDIVERGYQLPLLPLEKLTQWDVHESRANPAFFPGYPQIAKRVKNVLNLATIEASLVTAQLFCVYFWCLFFCLLRLWQVPWKMALFGAFTLLVYPASFFLVAGYSESLFLSSLVGLILCFQLLKKLPTQAEIVRAQGSGFQSTLFLMTSQTLIYFLAAVHGFSLSATRLVGLPLALYPWVEWFASNYQVRRRMPILEVENASAATRASSQIARIAKPLRLHPKIQSKVEGRLSFWGSTFVSLLTAAGTLSFFWYCQQKFGKWDLYIYLQKLGWGNEPNYLAMINPLSYLPHLFFENTVDSVSRSSNLFILFVAVLALREEWIRHGEGIMDRLGLYFCAFCLFFVPVSGKANYNMDSMVRYNLLVFTILIFILIHLYQSRKLQFFPGGARAKKIWTFSYVMTFAVQLWMLLLFMRGKWVA